MTRIPIHFENAGELVQFVNIVSCYDYAIELKSDDCTLDAKSIVGTIVMSKAEHLEMIVHTKDCQDLVSRVAAYA